MCPPSAIDTSDGVHSPTVVMSLKFATVKHSLLPAAVDTRFGNDIHLWLMFYPRDATLVWYLLLSFVCPSVTCRSKRLNVGSRKQCHVIAQGL